MSDLYLLARNRRILVHLHSSIDHPHSFTTQHVDNRRHRLTADPASDALRCRNAALGGKRTAKSSPAAAVTYGTNCSCSSMFQHLSRDLSRCSFLLLSVMPGGYFKGTTFVFFRCTPYSDISQTTVGCNWPYNRTKVSGYTRVINKWFHELRTFDGQLL